MIQVKKVATNQIESVAEATSSLGIGIKKSISNCTKEASRLTASFTDFVDVQGILKSITKAIHPESNDRRNRKVIHPRGILMKYPRGSY